MHANDSRVGMASIFLGRDLENNCILEICRNNHLVWFIFIAITNTVGILPIIYILTHRRSNQVTPTLNQR